MKTIPKDNTCEWRSSQHSRRRFLRRTAAVCLGGFALGASRLLGEEGASGESAVWSKADLRVRAGHVSYPWQDRPIPLKQWREEVLRQPHNWAG